MTTHNTEEKPDTAATSGRMQRLVRLIKWAFWNGLYAWGAWEAVHGNIGAGRVIVFVTWTLAIIYTLASWSDEVCEGIRKKGTTVPGWLNYGFDIGLMGVLVWSGWWFTAIAALVMTIAILAIRTEPNV